MKINDALNGTSAALPVSADISLDQASVGNKLSQANPNSAAIGEAVVTSKSSALQSIEATKGSSASFDVDKVAAIKAALDKNDYKIVPGDIADGLILSARDFLATMESTANQISSGTA
jgi:anti-sigma28 factor (negative regulator of flagellin synthesis)